MSNSLVSIQDIFSLIHHYTGIPEIKLVLPVPLAKLR
jgi:hypothetical protein